MDTLVEKMAAPPAIVPRPALAKWMFDRGLKPKDAEDVLLVGREQVRRYCLPFGDPLRVVPPPPVMRRIISWTAGEVAPADFYEPRIQGPGPSSAGGDA